MSLGAVILGLLLVLQPAPQAERSPETRQKDSGEHAARPLPNGEIDRESLRVRRETATFLLVSLGEEAKQYRNDAVRARVQARVADTLWEIDKDVAIALFRRAWEAAIAADHAQRERLLGNRGSRDVTLGSASIRREVLRMASSRDLQLGEHFVGQLTAELEGGRESADRSSGASTNASGTVRQRLQTGLDLLKAGDVGAAVHFADPALSSATVDALVFLSELRLRDAAAADARFMALANRSGVDPNSDANVVLLLSSYLLSPGVFVAVSRSGGLSTMQMGRRAGRPTVPPGVRQTFFENAARVLLRPVEELAQTALGVEGSYLAIARLFPYFQREAPIYAARLQSRMNELSAQVPESLRSPNHEALRSGLGGPASEQSEDLSDLLERARSVATSAQRDELYVAAALQAAATDDSRAHEIADAIEDAAIRRSTHAYIDFDALAKALAKRRARVALDLARRGELTPIKRVWGYTGGAALIAKDDPVVANQALSDALAIASKIDAESADRPRALLAVAHTYLSLDPTRSLGLASDAARAAERAPGFTGEDGAVEAILQTGTRLEARSENVDRFDIAPTFGQLAQLDFDGALLAAKSFPEAPRAVAILSIARSMLNVGRSGRNAISRRCPRFS